MSSRAPAIVSAEAGPALGERAYRSRSQWQQVWDYVSTDRAAVVGAALILLVMVMGIAAPGIAPRDPLDQSSAGLTDLGEPLAPGANGYLAGTDSVGRDVASRLIFGARTSLVIGVSASALTLILGLAIGGTAGYAGGIVSMFIMRGVDILTSFPGILLAIALAAVLKPSLFIVILVLGAVSWTYLARVVYGETLSLREAEYVTAARCIGATGWRIVLRHIAPHLVSVCMVYGTLGIASTIRAEATLSYLGVGVPPPTPTWGSMIREGQQYFRVAPWLMTYPGIAVVITVLGFNLVGGSLRDAFDPRRRRRTK
ncbi:MAG: ABC transporter permease [Chloroflexi bacterium]|nr:ABC transporter permease [Chloroflexota bacterium]